MWSVPYVMGNKSTENQHIGLMQDRIISIANELDLL